MLLEAFVSMVLSGDMRADINHDWKVDARDVAAFTEQSLIKPKGIYSSRELWEVEHNPNRDTFKAEMQGWWDNLVRDPSRLSSYGAYITYAHRGAALKHLGGDVDEPMFSDLIIKIRSQWPGSLTRHEQVAAIFNLCEISSLTGYKFDFIFDIILDGLKDGSFYGTNLFKSIQCYVWICQTRGIPYDPFADYGKAWGMRRLLTAGFDSKHFPVFDGTDTWYWAFTARASMIATCNDIELGDLQEAYDHFYYLPIKLSPKGLTAIIGASKVAPKEYDFYGGWKWCWPRDDYDSRAARAHIDYRVSAMTFDDLTVPDTGDYDFRPIGYEDLGRLEVLEGKDCVIFIHKSDWESINGGHRTPGTFPQFIIRTPTKTIYSQ